ncbi:MAG: amidohydrolase family protein [Actinobacteria bacterium]|nr:amidohydrolase family protein [Actinomycetota bacterium]
MTTLVLHRASLGPGREADVVVRHGRIAEVTAVGRATGDDRVDLGGRPLLPGLVDHHVHLFASAASLRSVDLGPAALVAAGGLDAALRAARARTPHGWLRGVGYDVAASGPLDRDRLDRVGVGPLRIQDRTGILWFLDGRALAAVVDDDPSRWPDGLEQADGRPTGVLRRLDHWLGHRLPSSTLDLDEVGRLLVAAGVTAVMDAGADNDRASLLALAAAGLPCRLHAMTRDAVVDPVDGVAVGPVKILLDDADLPALDDVVDRVRAARAAGRGVAVHCVSEVQLALALAAGVGPGDRIEHASMVSAGALRPLAEAGPTLVLQPALVRTRGDRYLAETDPADRPALHRSASFRRAGLWIAASSDAPYGPSDPWTAITAAVERRTAGGRSFGPDEAITATEALASWTGAPDDPAVPRTIEPGDDADLVVLDADWSELARSPEILTTVVGGDVVHGRWPTP